MGNYCSSGQNKKDKDNLSQKSEDSPTYQLASKNKKHNKKEAPLVDPEPTSDISNFNTSTAYPSNGNVGKSDTNVDITKAPLKSIQGIHSGTHESTSSSPLALNAPCDIPATDASTQQSLPPNLSPLYGAPTQNRRTENERKIVLYILAADDEHKEEKCVLNDMYQELKEYSASRGFELQISDAHAQAYNFLDPTCWIDEPLEARGGHHLAAQCLSEISRHSNQAYIVPVLFLGTTLGCPLLPLTIESQDFVSAFQTTGEGSPERQLLERWYILDANAEPPCYRLRTTNITTANDETAIDLQQLYKTLVDIFTKELRDSYLTTVIEQEINNTVLISQELSKRCIWIHTGPLPSKCTDADGIESVANEMCRRLTNIQLELKNQLCEKHLIRIPPTIQVPLAASLKSLLTANIDSICDDHANKFQIPHCTYGVDRNLLAEIEAVNQNSNLLSQNCANFAIMDKIKQYVTSTSKSNEPLIVYGPTGGGKSALSAKIAQIIHTWLPDCCFAIRYTGLTPLSSDLTSLIGSIAEQISYFTRKEPFTETHTLDNYTNAIRNCIAETKFNFVILIDSLDEALHLNDFDWLPTQLGDKVKIILTINGDGTGDENRILSLLKKKLAAPSLVHLDQFSEQQWNEVVNYGGGNFYSTNAQLQLPDTWKSCDEKIPLKAKLLWWFAWLGEVTLTDTSLKAICDKVFDVIETRFGKSVTKFVLSLLCASRAGMIETELIELLHEAQLVDEAVPIFWMRFCWILGRGQILRQNNRITLMDNKLKCIARKRYADDVKAAHNILNIYYTRQTDVFGSETCKYQAINLNKFIELPYHAYTVKQPTVSFADSPFLTDLNWIHTKLRATKCVQCILNDIHLIVGDASAIITATSKSLDALKQFLELNIRPINYDPNQFYPLFKHFINAKVTAEPELMQIVHFQRWMNAFESIPISYLDIIDGFEEAADGTDESAIGYDVLANLGGNGYFVASLSMKRGEICVWNIESRRKERILTGISQPTALCPVGDHGAAVLCCREIKIIDLNKGVFRVTLKGVMNQKMPFFAYCNDAQHLVCLSRNRMYVNLMNLESGDCITTFKAGEDRFLNSLLVSGDGRILVCGDETQKPFPLLVWHLSQRKLLYDLRIPHHDFITSLSAITHEGSYVCVVAKELNEPAPNFIVVYDLQSGTLFKRWKPSCNTVSLSISQTNACVIAGLEDARILIWDLITGNCKYVLVGHTAPVTLLKLDPNGAVLLSSDKEGRDRSVRLWELSTGKSIAVHTPSKRITTCEILPCGKYVVLALENEPNLVTLELKNCETTNQQIDDNSASAADVSATTDAEDLETTYYGDEDLTGESFHM